MSLVNLVESCLCWGRVSSLIRVNNIYDQTLSVLIDDVRLLFPLSIKTDPDTSKHIMMLPAYERTYENISCSEPPFSNLKYPRYLH